MRKIGLVVVVLGLAGLACGTVEEVAPTARATVPDVAPTAAPLGSTADLAKATVQILALQAVGDSYEVVWSGSGSVIDARGLILTNGHVVDDRSGEYEFLGVAVTGRTDEPPELDYRAEIASADYDLDLAVIRIVADMNGNPVTPNLTAIALGDSDQVEIGDHLRVLGYPGIGGETITFTEGAVSGFTSERSVDGRAWIKTDATIVGGNSGGMAVNMAGQLIGIPTQASAGQTEGDIVDCRPVVDTNRDGVIDDNDTCVPIGGFINGLRPVNLALSLIEAAESGQQYVTAPIATAPSGGYDLSETYFYNLVFSDGVTDDNQPKDRWYALPAGSTELCAFWDYEGMQDGMSWSAYWFADGEIDQGASYVDETWAGSDAGNWWVCVTSQDSLPDGLYELALEVEGETLLTDSIYVGGTHTVVNLTVSNESSVEVCASDVSPSQAGNWGQDRLGPDGTLPAGASQMFSFASGQYDLLLTDCEGNTLREEYGLDLTQDLTYRFTGQQ
jgi:S1-C subfamily serine protease